MRIRGLNLNIFEKSDYREIINDLVASKRYLDKSITFQAMASHIRIQKPYLSKVMNGYADFNSDQMYMACAFLELSQEQSSYMLLLLEHERSIYPERREDLLKRISSIQDSYRDSKRAVLKDVKTRDVEEFDNSIHVEYYLDPVILIVHMFLTIPRYRKDIDLIAANLSLSREQINEVLQKLVTMGIVEVKNDQINVLVNSLHLPRESKIVSAHQQMIKQYGLYRMSRLSVEKKKSFSVTFTSNEESRKKIEIEFNNFLQKVREIAMDGKKTHCYQLNFDLFPW